MPTALGYLLGVVFLAAGEKEAGVTSAEAVSVVCCLCLSWALSLESWDFGLLSFTASSEAVCKDWLTLCHVFVSCCVVFVCLLLLTLTVTWSWRALSQGGISFFYAVLIALVSCMACVASFRLRLDKARQHNTTMHKTRYDKTWRDRITQTRRRHDEDEDKTKGTMKMKTRRGDKTKTIQMYHIICLGRSVRPFCFSK